MADSNRSHRVILLILMVLHLGLGTWYAMNTPYRTPGILLGQRGPNGGPAQVPDVGAPDERQHANYVQHVLDGKGIPVLDPKDPNLGENYQSHQPPLYYFLATGFAKLTGISNVDDAGAIRLRLLNVGIGALAVAGCFFLGMWGFRRDEEDLPWVGIGAGLFAALLPMNLALSGAISNDPLLFALCAWCLAFCAFALRSGWTAKVALGAGLCGALAVFTKTTGIALVVPILIAVTLAKPRIETKALVAGILPYLVIVFPWFLRNFQVYGDPLAISAFNQAFVNSPQASVFIQGFGPTAYWLEWVGWWTARSFFGAFGYMDIFLNETGTPRAPQEALYRLLSAALLLTFFAWIALTKREDWKVVKPVQVMNSVFLLVVVLLFVRFNLQYFQGQARYILPAIGAIGCGVGLVVASAKNRALAMGAVALILLGLNGYVISRLPSEFAKRTAIIAQP